MEQTRFEIAVIGGGPAGYTAALYAARAGRDVMVLEKLSAGGQMASTSWVENYPGFEGIDGFALGERMRQAAEAAGAVTVYDEAVDLRLSDAPKQVTATGGTYLADAVILAAGAHPRRLGLQEEEALTGRGVAYCAACDGAMYRDRTVAVVGGGNTAAGDALLLAKLCRQVYLVHRRDAFRAEAVYRRALERAENVTFLWNSTVEAILHGERVEGLALRDTRDGSRRELAVDAVFVAVGRLPATELVKGQLSLDGGGYIQAGEDTRTEIPGVFAAGDLRAKPFRQIVTAAADGAVAAHMAGAYLDSLPR